MQKHAENFTPASHRIVVSDEGEIGLLAVEEEDDHVWLVKIYLRSHVRNRGIGGRLVTQVIQEAQANGKPVRLRVLRVNQKAKSLYVSLGFKVISETPERFFMERPLNVA